MKNIVTYEPESGRILWSGHADPKSLPFHQNYLETEAYSAAYDATHYVVDGALAPRPEQAITWPSRPVVADGTDEVVLTGALADTQVQIFGPTNQSGVAEGSDIHLTFVLPGVYTVLLNLFPYQDLRGTINAV